MKVECKIMDYNHVKIDSPKVIIRSQLNGNQAKIEFESGSCVVDIAEMISALERCRLDGSGR